MAFCNMCGTQIPDGATTCAACAGRAATAVPAQAMTDNVAGMLAYITIIPAIIFLVMAPYNRCIRFHSWQCLLFAAALFAAHFVLAIVPFLSLLMLPLHALISLGAFILWIVLLVKANQGEMYKLPIIGDIAERQANAM